MLSQAANYLLRAQMATIADTLEEDQRRKREFLENALAHHIHVGTVNADLDNPGRWARKQDVDDQLLHRGQPSATSVGGPTLGLLRRFMVEHPRTLRALHAILLIIVAVMTGACFFRWGTQADTPPDWMDCIYFAVVMCTTVGYGDFEILYIRDRIFTALYVLLGTIITAFAVSVIVEVSLNLEGKERKEELNKLFKVSAAICHRHSLFLFVTEGKWFS